MADAPFFREIARFQSDGGFLMRWFVPDSGFWYFIGIYLFTSRKFESDSETLLLCSAGGSFFLLSKDV